MHIHRRNWLKSATLATSGLFTRNPGFFAADAPAHPRYQPKAGERIVFLGDSITQGGSYVAYLETLLRLRFPAQYLEIHNHGISSETISGTSELDHNPRRPWAHERFTRDVTDWKPDTVFSCFGMNDGNYHPFVAEKFEKYQEGIKRLIARTRDEAKASRLFISTPPPYDADQRKIGDPEATYYGYRYPYVNYDQTLAEYARWLLTLQNSGQPVVDLHTRVNAHLKARRVSKVSFTMMPDAVHPNATGHALMAIVIAEGIGLAGPRDSLVINAADHSATADRGKAEVMPSQKEVVIKWQIPACWAFGTDVDANSLALERFDAKFNRLKLAGKNVPPGLYRLTLPQGGSAPDILREVTSAELENGILIDSPSSANAADHIAGVEFSAEVMKHRQASSAAWRNRAMKLPRNDPARGPLPAELEAEARAAAALSQRASALTGPIEIRVAKIG
ncbi:MAG: SGNH/GDSL hydrolase family protein [bacterium]